MRALPEYKYANANYHVRYKRADGRHVDELVEIEYGRQGACENIKILLQYYIGQSIGTACDYQRRLRKSSWPKTASWFCC